MSFGHLKQMAASTDNT